MNNNNSTDQQQPLLRVENLTTVFETGQRKVTAVDNVSFQIQEGETFSLRALESEITFKAFIPSSIMSPTNMRGFIEE